MSFLDAALRNARRGFPVTPVRGKGGFLPNWPNTATCDEAQIRAWAAAYPDVTNCGVVFGGKYVGLDSDLVSRLMELAKDRPEWFETYSVTSGRPDRRHWYYLATPEALAFGNRSFAESKERGNIFEVKAAGALLVAEGSVHPDTGGVYQATELPLIPFPAGLLQLLKSLVETKSGGGGGVVQANDFKLRRLLGFLEHYEISVQGEPTPTAGGWRVDIECPWAAEHSGEGPRETSVFWSPVRGFGFKCLHGHCDGRNWHTLTGVMEKRFPDKPRYFGKLPAMTHADIARHFVESNDDFVAIYDVDGRPIASFVTTRWDIRNDTHLLRKAVRDFLDELFHRYPNPEEGKPDYRLKLKSANFADSVTREVRPLLPPVHSSTFDRDPYLLGLPAGNVVDLRTSVIRPVTREDGLTRRINVMPVKIPIDRFLRFIREISCGDKELGDYILRLLALCLTGMAAQNLFFFWGRGRNGKGVLIRLLGKLLGTFFFPLRTNDLTLSRMSGDAEKRTLEKFRGIRAAAPGEAVGRSLNFALLKVLSGGDTLTGARMRQDETAFVPTHKLILVTNERPQIPADPAFRGRVHFAAFHADFRGREDRSLEPTLEAELPGILYQLLEIVPDVIRKGLNPPACVLRETEELFAELDVTQQFWDDCLEKDEDAFITPDDLREAVGKWRQGGSRGVYITSEREQGQVERILGELRHREGVTYKDKRLEQGRGGRKQRCYFGIRLRQMEEGS
jgi:P4 family phage/plasmid primase-like protien